jgi:hypothetical protein
MTMMMTTTTTTITTDDSHAPTGQPIPRGSRTLSALHEAGNGFVKAIKVAYATAGDALLCQLERFTASQESPTANRHRDEMATTRPGWATWCPIRRIAFPGSDFRGSKCRFSP